MEEKHVFTVREYSVEKPISQGKKTRKRKVKKKSGSCFIVALLFFSLTFAAICATFIYLDSNGLIPENLFFKILLGAGGFILLELFLMILSRKSRIVAALSVLLCMVVLGSATFGVYALYQVYQSVEEVEPPKTYYAFVDVYAKQGSRFVPVEVESEEEDEGPQIIPGDSLDGCSVGTMLLNLDRGYTSQAIRDYRKQHDISVIAFDDFGSMIDAFRDGDIDAVIYNKLTMKMFLGEDSDFYDWATCIESLGVEKEHTIAVKKADVVTEPFAVYICGIDTLDNDEFWDLARCDTNLIACVNPIRKKILVISTPRDYYVPLWGESYAMDKLTHAGIYGVETSVETLEALYDLELNYYVRTNVYSLVRIVDALGGITVHSDYEFYCANGIGGYQQFYVGDNDIDGSGALCFVRERSSFDEGDKIRGLHQMEVIKAIVRKACSPAIVAHFNDVLGVVTNSVETNIGKDEINAIIKMQLSDMASWTFESYAVDGYGIHAGSYALGGTEVYMMMPYYDTVNEAREKISEFMNE